MADGVLSIKLRCASWQQLATIYKRDLSRGTMFLKAVTPPAVGTSVRIDLTLPSASVIALSGVVQSHINDPQRGAGVELKLEPIPAGSVWLIESALASEHKRLATPVHGVPIVAAYAQTGVPAITEAADVAAAEQELIKALVSEAESLKKLNPFLVLGVGYEAADAEVRAAFGELTKRYHPDRFARYESPELREVAAEIFILIRDAYRRLGDAVARAHLLQSLGKPAPAPRAIPGPPRPPQPVPPPRKTQQVPLVSPPTRSPTAPPPLTMRAKTTTPAVPTVLVPPVPGSSPASGALPRATAPATTRPAADERGVPRRPSEPPTGEPSRAATKRPSSPPPLTPASNDPRVPPRRAPNEPAAPAALPAPPVTAPRRAAPSQPPVNIEPIDVSALEDLIDLARLDEALAGFQAMAKKHPHDRNVRAGIELCEGLRAFAARDRLEAAQRFEAALEIDPSNERAARELAEMRRQATNERKGLLSRLMGKKEG